MKYSNLYCLLLMLIFFCNSWAVAEPEIVDFGSKQVTQDDFVEALTPEQPQPQPQGRYRNLRGIKKVYAVPKEIGVNVSLTFEFDSARLTKRSKQVLDAFAGAMNNQLAPYIFRIEGYTDAVGEAPYNMTLSKQRANAVKGYLISKYSFEPVKLEAVGKGETHLINALDPSAAENRRVQIINAGLAEKLTSN